MQFKKEPFIGSIWCIARSMHGYILPCKDFKYKSDSYTLFYYTTYTGQARIINLSENDYSSKVLWISSAWDKSHDPTVNWSFLGENGQTGLVIPIFTFIESCFN